MTRSDSSISYEPDGTQELFAVPFPVFSADDINAVFVVGTTETPATGFAVEGLGTEAGTYVRFFVAPSAGQKLVIYRWTKRVQETDYPEGGRFPAKVVETDLDRLAAMAQEEEDLLKTVVRVPRDAEQSPAEYLADFFTAAEEAKAARDEANSAATGAANSAANAENAAAGAARDAAAAAQSAAEAAEAIAEGAPIGSETQRGIVRLATKEEHEAGAAGLAATPEYVKEMIEAGGGQPDGYPLLSLLWETSTLDKPGFLRANVNHGLIPRVDENGKPLFKEAVEEIKRRYDAGDASVVTDAEWQAEFAAKGMCAKFAISEDGFRIPFYGVGRVSLAVAGGDFVAGEYREDQFQGHWHSSIWTTGAVVQLGSGSGMTGRPISAGRPTTPNANYYGTDGPMPDRSGVEPRTGDITHGPIVGMTPFIKMYGAVTEASEANLAALIAVTTALNGRVEAVEITANMSRQVLHVRDEKPSGTDGGTATTGSYRTRDLNAVVLNTIEGASLANNQITLPPGTYDIFARVPSYSVNGHRAVIYNVTDNMFTSPGCTAFAGSSEAAEATSTIRARLTFSKDTTFEIMSWITNSKATLGFGRATNVPGIIEIYTEVIIRRIA